MRRYRSSFRRRSTRKYYRPKYRTTRVQRANRIFKKFIRRTAQRTELKYVTSDANQEILAQQNFNFRVTPTTLVAGTSVNQRIGQEVKFVKVDLNIEFKNNSSTILNAPELQSAKTRCVIWTPRIDVTSALSYMVNLGYLSHIDYTQVSVLRDFYVELSPPYIREATNNDIAGGPSAYHAIKRMKIKFPRKVKMPSNGNLDQERFALYMTVYNSYLTCITYFTAKLWFIDT